MKAVVARGLEGEILLPSDGVQVYGRVHPLRPGRIKTTVPAGLSIREILDIALAGERNSALVSRFDVFVDGHLVYEKFWRGFRVKKGRVVTFVPVLRGNGLGRTLGLLAIAVLAIVLPPLLPLAGLAAGIGVSVGVAQALVGLGIITAGSLLVNALFPVRPPVAPDSVNSAPAVYAIGGARNQADPFGPVSAILGRVRVSPKYAANPYTEISGDDQYLRLLFCVGYGALNLSDSRIGETAVDSYEDITIEQFSGYSSDTAPTLYPTEVFQEDLSVDITFAAGPQDRTTADNIGSYSVDFVAPAGFIDIDSDGNRSYYQVHLEIQHRLHASGADWTTGAIFWFGGKTQQAQRTSWYIGVPVRGKYDVRITKLSGDYVGDDTVVEQVVWSALRGFRADPVVTFARPVALIAMRIKATAQLNNTIDTFNLIASSRVVAYDESSGLWVADTISNNPADLYRHVLQGPANARPVTDDRLDLVSLQNWHVYCTQKGFQFNLECDTRKSVLATLQDIASAGRARVTRVDGKWGVIWDELDQDIVQHFTPRNSWGFSGERKYVDFPHAFRCRFIDEDNSFQQNERIVYADGYNASNATLFEQHEFPGVTKSSLIYKHARFQLAQAQLRPEQYSLSTNWQVLACTTGDRVAVAHDVPMFGLVQGRVKSIATDGDGNQTVTLDEEVVMDGVKSYAIEFRLQDGTSLVRSVATEAGSFTTLSLLGAAGAMPEAGDLAMFGEADSTTVILRVLEIKYQPDLRATLTLVDDAPAISTADTGAIPPFDSQISVPDDLFLLKPVNLNISEFLYLTGDNQPAAGAHLTWEVVKAGRITGFEVMFRNDGLTNTFWELAGRPGKDDRSIDISDLDVGNYSFRVRAFFDNGTASDWTVLGSQHFAGLLEAPPDVQNFKIERLNDIARLSWDSVGVVNLAGYMIRYSNSEVGATWGGSTILVDKTAQLTIDVPLRSGTYSIKAFTTSGVFSDNASFIINDFNALDPLNVVETATEDPSFAGTKTDVFYDSSISAIRIATIGFDLRGDADLRTVANLRAVQLAATSGTYDFSNTIDLGQVYTSRISSIISAVGDDVGTDFFDRLDFFDPADFFSSNPEAWAVNIEFRSTNDDPLGTPTWTAWVPLVLGDYSGRAFQFRAILVSLVAPTTPVVTGLSVTIDMPDRLLSVNDVSVPDGGVHISFTPPFHSFKGVAIAAQGLATGDYYTISGKSETGFDIEFFNASNVSVARTFDYIARGYGGQQT